MTEIDTHYGRVINWGKPTSKPPTPKPSGRSDTQKERQHNEVLLHNEKMCNEHERHAISTVMTLGLFPFKDGDQWCFLWGENLHSGVFGFGDTVMLACFDFYRNLKEKL